MKTSTAIIPTASGNAYIQRLCEHFSHKIKTSCSDHEGLAYFPYGEGRMFSDESTLQIEISADTFENLIQLKYIFAKHLEKFAEGEKLALQWKDEPPIPAPDWEAMGRQLRHPEDEEGKKIGISMNHANMGMIRRMFELIDLKSGQQVLEIGPGNAAHVKEILSKQPGVIYTGVEISKTMITEAAEQCGEILDVSLIMVDGKTLPFADEAFDAVVSANTIYFWENPVEYAKEIARVLKKDRGVLCLAFIHKSFMEKLPFTRTVFELYTPEDVKNLLEKAGLLVYDNLQEVEEIWSNTGERVERERVFILAKRK